MAGRKKTARALIAGSIRRTGVKGRDAELAVTHVLGEPIRPAGFKDTQYRAWAALCTKLRSENNLYRDDGPLLAEIIEARARVRAGVDTTAAQQRVKEILALLDARRVLAPQAVPAVAPETADDSPREVPELSLAGFLQAVKLERATFENRMVPGTTVVALNAQPYGWPAGAAATIARDYCDAVLGGAIESCELLKRAAARHLDDLKHGAERGLFYDTVAADNIVQWFTAFCGLALEPWEVWIVTSIFAWKKVTGYRRFREAWLSVARKNGKTALSGGIGLFGMVADQERYAEVYSAATKREQAVLAFRAAQRMRDSNPELKEYVRKQVSSLFVEDTDCFFQTLSADARTTDGLNPHIVLADELHEWQGRDYWDKLQTALVNRKQPLLIATTTAGNDLNSFAADKEDVGEKLLTGIFPNDDLFVAMYRMEKDDSYKDAAKWVRSNPNLGITVQVDALRAQLTEIEEDPTKLNAFLRYHCNQWVTLRVGASLPDDRVVRCVGPQPEQKLDARKLREWFLEKFGGTPCWAGWDYGEVNDLCCLTLLWKNVLLSGSDGEWVVAVPFYFMPEDGLVQKEKRWRVPLVQWCREKWLTTLPGDISDPTVLKGCLTEILGRYRPRALGFDGWGTRTMCSQLNDERICQTAEVKQLPGLLSVPSKEFKTAVMRGTFGHLNNPVLLWNMRNVQLETDKTNGMVPRKMNLDANKKIDGISAIVTAWAMSLDPEYNKPKWDGTLKFI